LDQPAGLADRDGALNLLMVSAIDMRQPVIRKSHQIAYMNP
jgi:hypothetical protein